MKKRLINYLRAGYSGIYIVSHEEARVESCLAEVVEELNTHLPQNDADNPQFGLFTWSVTDGVTDVLKETVEKGDAGPVEVLEMFEKAPERTVYLCRDFHLFVEEKNAMIWRKMKDVIASGRGANKAFIVVGCRLCLPPELEKEITVLDFSLPDRDQLRVVLDNLVRDNAIDASLVDDADGLVAAASGLTLAEAEQAFGLSSIETGHIRKDVVFREKCLTVRKNGMLEVVESKVTLDDIGGLEEFKKWLLERREAFTDKARKYGLPIPKGFLAVGQPGTGKTLSAKAVSSVLGVPCLRLDASKLFGSLVGQSESNWRAVHATAKAMAPCVLHIDEVDGAMSGSGSSGQTDGGTTARVVKSILQDMQDNSEGIFYVLTANDIDSLPDPLLRRMDEVWNFELPTAPECALIWGIQIAKHGRKPEDYDLDALGAKSVGFSGAEIEKVFSQALYRAFVDGMREPTMEDATTILADFSPLSKTMADSIEKRKKRLAGVAKLAGGTVKVSVAKPTRKLTRVNGS